MVIFTEKNIQKEIKTIDEILFLYLRSPMPYSSMQISWLPCFRGQGGSDEGEHKAVHDGAGEGVRGARHSLQLYPNSQH